MKEQGNSVEVLPLGRADMRIVNQRAQALSHAVFVQLREELRLKACEAIASGQDVHGALAVLSVRAIVLSAALPSATTAASVVSAHSTPPVGTPSPVHHEGNSAPARALVTGAGKSERTGERGGEK